MISWAFWAQKSERSTPEAPPPPRTSAHACASATAWSWQPCTGSHANDEPRPPMLAGLKMCTGPRSARAAAAMTASSGLVELT